MSFVRFATSAADSPMYYSAGDDTLRYRSSGREVPTDADVRTILACRGQLDDRGGARLSAWNAVAHELRAEAASGEPSNLPEPRPACRWHGPMHLATVSPQAAELGTWYECPRIDCTNSHLFPSPLLVAQLLAQQAAS